jgi:outer membrane immunogenic protein
MKKALMGIAAIAALLGTPALAADMPIKAPSLAPPVSDWSGFYLGAELGAVWGSNNWTTTCLTTVTNCANGPGPTGANPFFVDASSPATFKTSSVRGGLYAGYQQQLSNLVVGIEADGAYSDSTQTVAGIVGCQIFCGFGVIPNPADSTSVRLNGDGSLRARLGFLAMPNLLIYGAGGFAVQGVSATATCGPGLWCVALRNQTDSTLLPGYTIGGGLEWKYSANWFLRAEYRYSAFTNFNPSFFTGTVDEIDARIHVHTSMANVGIAYKFGN